MSHRKRLARRALSGLTATASPWLLRRMATEFADAGVLSSATTAWMYTTYGAHATLYADALKRPVVRLPLATRTAKAVGVGTALLGGVLCGAGVSRFNGAGQLSGTRSGPFVTGGVYRFTRNPQYLGYVLALAGGAVVRRSAVGMALALAAGGAFAWWVPVEEQHLRREVGPSYEEYLSLTPRWLGLAVVPSPPTPGSRGVS